MKKVYFYIFVFALALGLGVLSGSAELRGQEAKP